MACSDLIFFVYYLREEVAVTGAERHVARRPLERKPGRREARHVSNEWKDEWSVISPIM